MLLQLTERCNEPYNITVQSIADLPSLEVRQISTPGMAAVDKEIDDLIGDGKQASNENWVQDEKPDHDGVFEEVDGNAEEEAQEKLRREREAMAQALTLEIVGDLPFAEVKPPENVLFVCKLNPVTEG